MEVYDDTQSALENKTVTIIMITASDFLANFAQMQMYKRVRHTHTSNGTE